VADDLGASWRLASWEFSKSTFVPFSILNFGQDYAGARDEYVYSYGHGWGGSKQAFLVRVHKDQIQERSAYQFFAGLDGSGQAKWSAELRERQPVFSDANGKDENLSPSVVYHPVLERYLLTASHGGPQRLGVFDGPQPWGPWTTVAYYENWGGFSGTEALLYSFPSKWISPDGKTMWMVFSSTGTLDSFNLVKATLKLHQ
jgi:hypothetical protein